MNKNIMRDDVEKLLRQLISVESPYFHEDKIMDLVLEWMESRGIPAKLHCYHEPKITDFHGKNIVGCLDSGLPGPVIYLNGHLDTVDLCRGWNRPPYEGVVEGDRMYGVGALDMKSGCAAILLALEAFISQVPTFEGKLIYHFVSDEEGPFGLGTTYLVLDGMLEKADFAIVAEPSAGFTGLPHPCVCLGARGGYNYTIRVHGKSAHAANPEMGVNALSEAAKFICELDKVKMRKDDKLVQGSNCVISLKGGGAACSVPDVADIEVFRHTVRGEDKETIRQEVFAAAERADLNSTWELLFRETPAEGFDGGFVPYTVDEDNDYVKKLCTSISGVCGKEPKLTYFSSIGDFNIVGGTMGIPTVLFGPDGSEYHSSDEWVSLSSVEEVASSIYHFLLEVFAAER